MAQVEISKEWRDAVCAVLKTEDTTNRIIRWTSDARTRYESDFLGLWPYQVYAAMRRYLESDNATGCPKSMDHPTGETYEFFFELNKAKTYGKILLRPDRIRIVLFSAHFPARETLSCE